MVSISNEKRIKSSLKERGIRCHFMSMSVQSVDMLENIIFLLQGVMRKFIVIFALYR